MFRTRLLLFVDVFLRVANASTDSMCLGIVFVSAGRCATASLSAGPIPP